MDVYDNMILSKARTQYRNIMNTLDGEMVTGNEHGYFTKGKVAIGASSPELMQEFKQKKKTCGRGGAGGGAAVCS